MFHNKKKGKNIDNQIQSEQTNISTQKKQNLYTIIFICISTLSRLFVISCLLVLFLLLLSQFDKWKWIILSKKEKMKYIKKNWIIWKELNYLKRIQQNNIINRFYLFLVLVLLNFWQFCYLHHLNHPIQNFCSNS